MTDEQTPALAAGDEAIEADETIIEADAPDEGEEAAGQEKDQPEDEETKSRSKIRREKRQENEKRLREQAADALAKAKDAEARLARIRAAAEGEQEPKEGDFADVIEFAAAKAVWKSNLSAAQRQQREIESEAKEHKTQADAYEQQRITERAVAFNVQKEEARQRYADLDQVMAVAGDVNVVSSEVAQMVIESDSAVDVAYYLGKNPALARQISQLPPLSAARELGKIEANLTRPKARTQSTAPDPISPVKPSGTVQKDPTKMSATEFAAWRASGGTF